MVYDHLTTAIHRAYIDLGVVSGFPKSEQFDLRKVCEHRSECWKQFEGTEGKTCLSRPWIGKHFEQSRVLVLGINMNDDHGWDECYNLIECAQREMREGRTVHFRRGTRGAENYYSGSRLFYRVAQIGAIAAQLCSVSPRQELPDDPRQIVDGFDWIAYTNHIKCSPTSRNGGDRSKPSLEMWQHCGSHVLLREVEILCPDCIVLFGSGDNYWYFREKLLDKTPDIPLQKFGHVKVETGLIHNRRVKLLGVPHPSMGAGLKAETWHSAQEALWAGLPLE